MTLGTKMYFYFFIPLLSPSESRPVIVSKTQEIVVRNQSFDWISYDIDVYWLLFNAKPETERWYN